MLQVRPTIFVFACAALLSLATLVSTAHAASKTTAVTHKTADQDKALHDLLQQIAGSANKSSHQFVAEGLRFDQATVNGKEIRHTFTLTQQSTADLVPSPEHETKLIETICSQPDARDMINKGAIHTYIYNDKVGKQVLKVSVGLAQCQPDTPAVNAS